MERRELALDRCPVLLERRGAAREQVEDRSGGKTRGDEALVHPITRDGVDQPGRIPDEQRALPRDPGASPAEREPVAAEAVEIAELEPVRLAGALEMLASASGPRSASRPTPTLAWSPFGNTQA